jgi:chromosome segregation ATPase
MKRTHLAIVALAATIVGCKQETDVPSVDEAKRNTAAQLDRAKKETKEAIDATRDYAYAQRAEYAANIRTELAELNKQLDQLSAKVNSSSAGAKAEAQAKLQELREKVARLGEKLDGVPNATESTWEDVKAGIKKGYDEVKDSFKQAQRWLSEKLAP